MALITVSWILNTRQYAVFPYLEFKTHLAMNMSIYFLIYQKDIYMYIWSQSYSVHMQQSRTWYSKASVYYLFYMMYNTVMELERDSLFTLSSISRKRSLGTNKIFHQKQIIEKPRHSLMRWTQCHIHSLGRMEKIVFLYDSLIVLIKLGWS